MAHQYRLIVRNESLYKEYIIEKEISNVSVGTLLDCEFRMSPSLFDEGIYLNIRMQNNQWTISCGNNLYLSLGHAKRFDIAELKHGDEFSVNFSSSGMEAFTVQFLIDFDAEISYYNWYVDVTEDKSIAIGSEMSNDLLLTGQYAYSSALELIKKPEGVVLTIKNSPYGVLLNGREIQGKTILKNHDFFSVSNFSFYYNEGRVYFDKRFVHISNAKVGQIEQNSVFEYPKFIRNTRKRINPNTDPVMVLAPPSKPAKPDLNLVTSLLPTLAMLILVVVMSQVMDTSSATFMLYSIFSMSIGVVTSIASLIHSRRKYKKDIIHRDKTYREYIEKKRDDLETFREEELEELNSIYMSPNEMLPKVLNFDSDIFDRTEGDEDYMDIYLGLGDRASRRPVEYREQESLETNDDLPKLPEQLKDEFKSIHDAPVILKLKDLSAVGVVASESEQYEYFKHIVADIASRQYHTETCFYLLGDDRFENLDWIKLLPQFSSDTMRNIVFDNHSRNSIFERLYNELSSRYEAQSHNNTYDSTHIVVFVLSQNEIITHPVSRFIPYAKKLNTTFVFFEESSDFIPLNCDYIIELNGNEEGSLISSTDAMAETRFVYSHISDNEILELARKIAPVYCDEISLENSLRKSVSLYETLGVYIAEDLDLEKRWANSDVTKSLAVPLGVDAKNEIVYLDLHEKAHGPHGLVAGTTGSGKSELLQSFILSTATLYHPHEVSFVIIDFKGGGMANQFDKLPHLIGSITNIDGKEIDRSLKSIKAELNKRQTLFAEAGVNHIDAYIDAYKRGLVKKAIPHLIIIVDEFAELKAEQPEFMKELISASRIGRSLGIHLILATQKPSGQVSEQIWSNSSFRICLKVQSPEDSKEVLKSSLAAEIKEPGRAYLQVGNNELFELFQSAYSGSPADKDKESNANPFTIYEMNLEGRDSVLYSNKKKDVSETSQTELDALVSYVSEYCTDNDIEPVDSICQPPLPELLDYTESVEKSSAVGMVPLGIFDDPEKQIQDIYYTDIAKENTVIIGASQTGKTNMLQSIIKYVCSTGSPEQANFYILDFDAATLKNFENLKHVGGVVLPAEEERVKNLFKMLLLDMDNRKNRFMKVGVSSYYSYIEAGHTDVAKAYVIIDNFTAFRELYMEKYEQSFVSLCRDGLSLGISVIITNSTATGVGYRFLTNFGNRIALTCSEYSEYSNLFDKCRIEPSNISGRILYEKEKTIFEAQTYLAFQGEREVDRVNSIRGFVSEINYRYEEHKVAAPIPEIPDILSIDYFEAHYRKDVLDTEVAIGLDFEEIAPVTINAVQDGELGIISKLPSKSTNVAARLINSLLQNDSNWNVHIVDSAERGLSKCECNECVKNYSVSFTDIEDILEEVQEAVIANKNCVINGKPMTSYNVIVINGVEAITQISNNVSIMNVIKELVDKYKYYGLLFIYSGIENRLIVYNSPALLLRTKENKKAIFTDNLKTFKAYEFDYGYVKKFPKPVLDDEVYYFNDGDVMKVKTFSDYYSER